MRSAEEILSDLETKRIGLTDQPCKEADEIARTARQLQRLHDETWPRFWPSYRSQYRSDIADLKSEKQIADGQCRMWLREKAEDREDTRREKAIKAQVDTHYNHLQAAKGGETETVTKITKRGVDTPDPVIPTFKK